MMRGAEGGTRTPMVLRPSAPQAGASANFATSAGFKFETSSSSGLALRHRRHVTAETGWYSAALEISWLAP
jgi:hypothetical protein